MACMVMADVVMAWSMSFADPLVDNWLRTEQTQRAPEGEQCGTADKVRLLSSEDTTASAI